MPGWPDDPATVEEANCAVIDKLTIKPAVIGHSSAACQGADAQAAATRRAVRAG
jgi:hypothetical protein